MKISSILTPNWRASLNASRIDGLYRPRSSEMIVWRDTLTRSDSSCWVQPFWLRNSSSLFTITSPNIKFTLHSMAYSLANVKHALHLYSDLRPELLPAAGCDSL